MAIQIPSARVSIAYDSAKGDAVFSFRWLFIEFEFRVPVVEMMKALILKVGWRMVSEQVDQARMLALIDLDKSSRRGRLT